MFYMVGNNEIISNKEESYFLTMRVILDLLNDSENIPIVSIWWTTSVRELPSSSLIIIFDSRSHHGQSYSYFLGISIALTISSNVTHLNWHVFKLGVFRYCV